MTEVTPELAEALAIGRRVLALAAERHADYLGAGAVDEREEEMRQQEREAKRADKERQAEHRPPVHPGGDFAQSTDARDWASAFVQMVRAHPSIATDEGTMIGWFANAIMRGYDEREAKERATKLARVAELQRFEQGETAGPRVQAKETGVLERAVKLLNDAIARVNRTTGLVGSHADATLGSVPASDTATGRETRGVKAGKALEVEGLALDLHVALDALGHQVDRLEEL